MNKLCAALINDQNHLLPYTCRNTMDQVKEDLIEDGIWEALEKIGCKIVQTRLVTDNAFEEAIQTQNKAMAMLQEMAISMMSNGANEFREPTLPEMQNWAMRAKELIEYKNGLTSIQNQH